jgi:4'-phosphopantetheinyl transferase
MRGRCDVVWIDLATAQEPPVPTYLDDEERRRADRYRARSDADLFVYRRTLTRMVVGRALGVPPADVKFARRCQHCGHPDHGKPRIVLPAGDLEISVSRTGTVVALAITSKDAVGLDIEGITGNLSSGSTGFARSPPRGLSESEERSVLREWTRKEAVLKAVGIGLALDPKRVTVSEPDETPAVLHLPPEFGVAAQFSLSEIALRPDIVGHIAIIGEQPDIALHDASSLFLRDV